MPCCANKVRRVKKLFPPDPWARGLSEQWSSGAPAVRGTCCSSLDPVLWHYTYLSTCRTNGMKKSKKKKKGKKRKEKKELRLKIICLCHPQEAWSKYPRCKEAGCYGYTGVGARNTRTHSIRVKSALERNEGKGGLEAVRTILIQAL